MPAKLRLLFIELKEGGLFYVFKRVVAFLVRPIVSLVSKSRFLLELSYGFLPKLWLPLTGPGFIKLPRTELVRNVRKFWYTNTSGSFNLDGEEISRQEIFIHGGPDPSFTCLVCQKAEWLSRVRQKNLFVSHVCSQAESCESICKLQGNDLWTHLHQNFNFAIGIDSDLPALRMLYLDPRAEENFLSQHSDIWQLLTQRRLAYSLQVDVAKRPVRIDWSKYDLVFMVNNGKNIKFKRPDIPLFLYGHDFWPLENKGFQWVIDWAKPDVFLSSALSCWQEHYLFPAKTKFVFYPFFDSLFFSRPNLKEKSLDLLVVGATKSSIYKPREVFNKQIAQFAATHQNKYKTELLEAAGSNNVFRKGPLVKKDPETGSTVRLLNKWSEYLSSAKYAAFGRVDYPFVTGKHYEVLGSGAVPILPEAPDLERLGVKPFEHYIPLSEVEGNNDKLAHFLDNYDKYKYIAGNALNWYNNNSDQMIFNRWFEDVIRGVTKTSYPKRLS